MGICEIGVEPDRLPVVLNRFVDLSLALKDVREMLVSRGGARVHRQRLSIARDRGSKVALRAVCVPEVALKLGRLGNCRDRPAKHRLEIVCLALVEQRGDEAPIREHELRLECERTLVVLDRSGELSLSFARFPSIRHIGISRVERSCAPQRASASADCFCSPSVKPRPTSAST